MSDIMELSEEEQEIYLKEYNRLTKEYENDPRVIELANNNSILMVSLIFALLTILFASIRISELLTVGCFGIFAILIICYSSTKNTNELIKELVDKDMNGYIFNLRQDIKNEEDLHIKNLLSNMVR